MSQKLRQEEILHILEKRGYVTVKYLTEVLHYSSATINRDLNAMQNLNLVKRSYGGVEIAQKSGLPPLAQRQFFMQKEKRHNAKKAAELIENGDSVFLGGGTTVQHIAPYLANKSGLRVITNNMRLAMELGEYDMDVICLGGHIKERPHVLYSDETVENAMKYYVDKMFFSVGKVTEDGFVCGGAPYLLHLVMLKNSKKAYLLTDHRKIVEHIDNYLCDFSALSGVIADFDFPEDTKLKFPNVRFINSKND